MHIHNTVCISYQQHKPEKQQQRVKTKTALNACLPQVKTFCSEPIKAKLVLCCIHSYGLSNWTINNNNTKVCLKETDKTKQNTIGVKKKPCQLFSLHLIFYQYDVNDYNVYHNMCIMNR